MNIKRQSKVNPSITLELFSPPGRDKMLVQVQGKQPNDGIPYELIPDLLDALRDLVEKYTDTFSPYVNQWNAAAEAMERERTTSENFVPYTVDMGHAAMLVEVGKCAHCHTTMTSGSSPRWHLARFEEQLKRARWRKASGVMSDADGGELCQVCADEGVAKFKCELCEELRPYAMQAYRSGDGYLCQVCFETVTAKEWKEAQRRLDEEHRWDFGG